MSKVITKLIKCPNCAKDLLKDIVKYEGIKKCDTCSAEYHIYVEYGSIFINKIKADTTQLKRFLKEAEELTSSTL